MQHCLRNMGYPKPPHYIEVKDYTKPRTDIEKHCQVDTPGPHWQVATALPYDAPQNFSQNKYDSDMTK